RERKQNFLTFIYLASILSINNNIRKILATNSKLLSSLLISGPRYHSAGHCNPSLPVSSDSSNWCDSASFQNQASLELLLGSSHSPSQLPSPLEEDCQQLLTIGQHSNDSTPTKKKKKHFKGLEEIYRLNVL
uniref:Ovule protein n=1 Tax=Elaeophora elaphi TaxID=1147741 RepID=A0A0R3RN57_9BILA